MEGGGRGERGGEGRGSLPAPGRWPSPPGRFLSVARDASRRTGQQPTGPILTTTCRSPVRRSASGRQRSSHWERGCGSGHPPRDVEYDRSPSVRLLIGAAALLAVAIATAALVDAPPIDDAEQQADAAREARPRTRGARPPHGGRPSPSVRLRCPLPPRARRPAAARTSGSRRVARSWPRWRSVITADAQARAARGRVPPPERADPLRAGAGLSGSGRDRPRACVVACSSATPPSARSRRPRRTRAARSRTRSAPWSTSRPTAPPWCKTNPVPGKQIVPTRGGSSSSRALAAADVQLAWQRGLEGVEPLARSSGRS